MIITETHPNSANIIVFDCETHKVVSNVKSFDTETKVAVVYQSSIIKGNTIRILVDKKPIYNTIKYPNCILIDCKNKIIVE